MNTDPELRAWLVLARTPGLGPAGLRTLLRAHGDSAGAVLAQPLDRLQDLHRLDAAARAWLRAPDAARIDADAAWLAAPGHQLLRCTDAGFPPQLEHIDQPPAFLFVAGDADLLLQPQVAIVGARAATPQGRADAAAFAAQLAATGLVITSGLADGIDGVAHAAALEAGGATIAVFGTGADHIYPRKHAALAQRITTSGALVSEFPPGTGPRREHFPRRNRLIAGLALGTLVIEADLRSGSLITARLAGEQGREVMAVPGSVHNRMKRGCHRLIRDGASLVESPGEVRALLREPARRLGQALAQRLEQLDEVAPAAGAEEAADLQPAEQALLDALGAAPLALDEIAQRSGLDAASIAAALLELELAGLVAALPGARYQRLHAAPEPPAGDV